MSVKAVPDTYLYFIDSHPNNWNKYISLNMNYVLVTDDIFWTSVLVMLLCQQAIHFYYGMNMTSTISTGLIFLAVIDVYVLSSEQKHGSGLLLMKDEFCVTWLVIYKCIRLFYK